MFNPLPRHRFRHSLPSCFSCSTEWIEIRFSTKRVTFNQVHSQRMPPSLFQLELCQQQLGRRMAARIRMSLTQVSHSSRSMSYLFLFLVHLLPFCSQQLSDFTYTWHRVICDGRKKVKADRQRTTRAYRNRHQGSQP